MPEGLREFTKQFRTFWDGLNNTKRIALVLATTSVLLLALLLPMLSSSRAMVPLYSNLEPEDAAKVVEKLEQSGVPYELRASGSTVLVPEERLYKLRLDMASEGLPKGSSVGFELFDKSQFGATEFEQHVNLRRALEGELSRSIATVSGVEAARVHLVLPRQSVFIAKKEEPSASVVVRLKSPALFGKREVAAVVHLVSAAVPGLSRNRVSLVSTEGLTLHRPSTSEGGIGSETLVEEAQTIAGTLEAKANAQLERVVGPSGADVRIAVTLDTSTREETKETYEPDKTALRSEQTSSEEIRNQSGAQAGIPGSRTNLPDASGNVAQAETNQNLDTTTRNSSTRNWEVDRAVAKIHTPPGRVARLSVAVLLDGIWKKGPNGQEVYEPRSEQEIRDLTELVKQAVGFDALRGDTITVTTARFQRPDLELDAEATPMVWYREPWMVPAAAGLFALLVILSGVLVWRSKKKQRELLAAIEAARLKEREQAEAMLAGGALDENGELNLEAAFEPKAMGGGPEAINKIREKALEIAAKDPSSTAVVLRAWLAEEEQLEEKAAE